MCVATLSVGHVRRDAFGRAPNPKSPDVAFSRRMSLSVAGCHMAAMCVATLSVGQARRRQVDSMRVSFAQEARGSARSRTRPCFRTQTRPSARPRPMRRGPPRRCLRSQTGRSAAPLRDHEQGQATLSVGHARRRQADNMRRLEKMQEVRRIMYLPLLQKRQGSPACAHAAGGGKKVGGSG